jgi:hypothetical protein
MEQEVLRVSEFCHCYAISRTALYREIWAGRLRILKRGRRTLITKKDAAIWVAELREKSNQNLKK